MPPLSLLIGDAVGISNTLVYWLLVPGLVMPLIPGRAWLVTARWVPAASLPTVFDAQPASPLCSLHIQPRC